MSWEPREPTSSLEAFDAAEAELDARQLAPQALEDELAGKNYALASRHDELKCAICLGHYADPHTACDEDHMFCLGSVGARIRLGRKGLMTTPVSCWCSCLEGHIARAVHQDR